MISLSLCLCLSVSLSLSLSLTHTHPPSHTHGLADGTQRREEKDTPTPVVIACPFKVCPNEFESRKQLAQHLQQFDHITTYGCFDPTEIPPLNTSESCIKKFICPECLSILDESVVNLHIEESKHWPCFPIKIVYYSCPTCFQFFNCLSKCVLHMDSMDHHRDPLCETDPTVSNAIPIPISQEVFRTIVISLRSFKPQYFVCSTCEGVVLPPKGLSLHLKGCSKAKFSPFPHHPVADALRIFLTPPWLCSVCGSYLDQTKPNLTRHKDMCQKLREKKSRYCERKLTSITQHVLYNSMALMLKLAPPLSYKLKDSPKDSSCDCKQAAVHQTKSAAKRSPIKKSLNKRIPELSILKCKFPILRAPVLNVIRFDVRNVKCPPTSTSARNSDGAKLSGDVSSSGRKRTCHELLLGEGPVTEDVRQNADSQDAISQYSVRSAGEKETRPCLDAKYIQSCTHTTACGSTAEYVETSTDENNNESPCSAAGLTLRKAKAFMNLVKTYQKRLEGKAPCPAGVVEDKCCEKTATSTHVSHTNSLREGNVGRQAGRTHVEESLCDGLDELLSESKDLASATTEAKAKSKKTALAEGKSSDLDSSSVKSSHEKQQHQQQQQQQQKNDNSSRTTEKEGSLKQNSVDQRDQCSEETKLGTTSRTESSKKVKQHVKPVQRQPFHSGCISSSSQSLASPCAPYRPNHCSSPSIQSFRSGSNITPYSSGQSGHSLQPGHRTYTYHTPSQFGPQSSQAYQRNTEHFHKGPTPPQSRPQNAHFSESVVGSPTPESQPMSTAHQQQSQYHLPNQRQPTNTQQIPSVCGSQSNRACPGNCSNFSQERVAYGQYQSFHSGLPCSQPLQSRNAQHRMSPMSSAPLHAHVRMVQSSPVWNSPPSLNMQSRNANQPMYRLNAPRYHVQQRNAQNSPSWNCRNAMPPPALEQFRNPHNSSPLIGSPPPQVHPQGIHHPPSLLGSPPPQARPFYEDAWPTEFHAPPGQFQHRNDPCIDVPHGTVTRQANCHQSNCQFSSPSVQTYQDRSQPLWRTYRGNTSRSQAHFPPPVQQYNRRQYIWSNKPRQPKWRTETPELKPYMHHLLYEHRTGQQQSQACTMECEQNKQQQTTTSDTKQQRPAPGQENKQKKKKQKTIDSSLMANISCEPTVEHLLGMTQIILVDLDNWPQLFSWLPKALPAGSFVWGFYGGGVTWKAPFQDEVFCQLVDVDCFHLHPKCGTTKNAADFALCTQAGRLDAFLPKEIPFVILSSDRGFMELKKQLVASNREAHLLDPRAKESVTIQQFFTPDVIIRKPEETKKSREEEEKITGLEPMEQ